MQSFPSFVTMLDGAAASTVDLEPLAFSGFAHFTAMQVRDGMVKGLDLHLKRLRSASNVLFGRAHSDSDILEFLRIAVAAGPLDLSLTATVFSRAGEFTAEGEADDPAILVRTFPASSGPTGPFRLDVMRHQRSLASIKQVGEPMKTYAMRRAVRGGYNDAAFIDAKGRIAEATIWNMAFWDGSSVVWPHADILSGITMQIVDRQLQKAGIETRTEEIRTESLMHFSGAALMNSWTPCVPVNKIGTAELPISKELNDALYSAYNAEPAVKV